MGSDSSWSYIFQFIFDTIGMSSSKLFEYYFVGTFGFKYLICQHEQKVGLEKGRGKFKRMFCKKKIE